VVPVGLTKYREGLYELEPFDGDDALKVIELIESWQDRLYERYGIHFVHASDEWYINAGLPLPEGDRYDGYLQLENGVGMVRLLMDEVDEVLKDLEVSGRKGSFSIATGKLIYPVIKELSDRMKKVYPGVDVKVYEIRNDFFGELITVTGLLTGGDIVSQLKGKDLGDYLCISESILRSDTDMLLDDMTLEEVSDSLHLPVYIVKSDGASFAGMYERQV
jgi:NifB/MoaA-like Fe-S oxidoreductase